MVYLTRKAEFSAAHFYHNPEFTPEENQRVFGKCNNPNGHGHNYTLEVTVKGAVDPKSGFVVDLKQLKDVMSREVLDAFDHRFLNKEVPEFLTKIPTTENLAIAIWQRLAPKLNAAQLHRVRVYETPDLFVDFYGEDFSGEDVYREESLAVTREHIRKIEAKALRKLRHPSRSRKLRASMDGVRD